MRGAALSAPGTPLPAELLDRIDSAIVQLDRDGRVVFMNAAAEQCMAAGRDRALGRVLGEVAFLPPELRDALDEAATADAVLRLHEISLAGGQYDCTIKSDADGGRLLELHDLEWENRRIRLQQRELQTGLLELLSRNLGHEIRNPLGGIRGAAQMLAAELESPEMSQLARLVMRESDRIEELLQSFGQPRLGREPFDLYRVLDEAIDLLDAEFGGDLGCERDYDPSIPPILGDGAAVRQVFLNLLRNAREAGATSILLRTRIEHGGVLLQTTAASLLRVDVMDNGEGVPESLRNLLFLPMVTGKRAGTGLGLALSQQIAASHGGMISYEPRAAGKRGSRFSVHLPLDRGAAASDGNGREERGPA
ncbi:two-component system sensor histidine kinase NtrB [Elongatibacter sediminis]|uniref:two-component system sensor histidine kinase NtrB n=1 Tax=Elongatibacter sediminis TaxID=3119006 RepID=UPI00339D5142